MAFGQAAGRHAAHRLAAVLAVVVTLGGLAGGSLTLATSAYAGSTASPVISGASGQVLGPQVVLIGVGGLTWEDIGPETTPRLWGLLEDGAAAAALTVNTLGPPVCPTGGWLALSAGRPTFGPRDGQVCRTLPAVATDGAGGDVVAWQPLAAAESGTTYEATIGTLGTALAASGECATAIGPGAALALADSSGHVARYLPALDDSAANQAFGCPLTVVDAGATSVLDASEADARYVDDVVGQVLDAAPATASIVVASVSSPEGGLLSLGTAVVRGPQSEPHYLSSPATRRSGVARVLDLPPSILAALGVAEPTDFQGSVLTVAGERPEAAATRQWFIDIGVADRWLRPGTSPLINTLGFAAIVLGGLVLLLARRRVGRGVLRVLEALLLIAAAGSVASYLVTLLRWWRFDDPYLGMWLGIAAIATVLGIASALLRGPVWRPAMVVSLVTSVVLLVDGVVGTPLHWGSPFGTSAALGNRYYGFGNSTYAVWAVATLVLAGAVATTYAAAGRRRLAGGVVLAIGMVSVIVDIWPTWGADVGGGLALVPAFVVLAMMLSGLRVTLARAVIAAVAGAAVVTAVAVADWLRPAADRSHAGQFVQSLLDGDAGDLLSRKSDNAMASFSRGSSAWITLAVLVLAVLALALPRMMPAALASGMQRWPQLRAVIVAVLISAVLGSLANDWGIRVATVELLSAAALVFAACARARAYDTVDRGRESRSDASTDRSPTPTAAPKTSSATAAAAAPPPTAPMKETSAKR